MLDVRCLGIRCQIGAYPIFVMVKEVFGIRCMKLGVMILYIVSNNGF